MNRTLLAALATLAALASSAAPASAQTKTGTAVGQFLLIEPSARITGMGNAGVSIVDGLQAVYYNPGVIGHLDRYELAFSRADWLAGIRFDHAAMTVPLGRWGNAVASVTALNSGEIEVRTVTQPLGTGERYSVTNVALGVGYGFQITDRVAAGAQINFVQETIWHTSASTFTLNVGTLYQLSPNGLLIGASLSNFGTSERFSGLDLRIDYDNDPSRLGDNNTLPGERYTQNYSLPQVFRVGLGMPYRLAGRSRLLVVADVAHPSDNTESASLGAELTIREMIALRAGYQSLFQEDSEVGLTLGAGVQGGLDTFHYRLDYAWADQGRLEATHRLTVGVTF
ncbi:MAG: hypothetical protein A2W00_10680 [Candidatus Eisenbacteria bacterium RBG_16_71_46]|nr:MAG: hypothetical protein A2W00_10680 [Candidatus Eisenbacteria bacterium RBG_16_71_46]